VAPDVHDNQDKHSQGQIKMCVAVIMSVHTPEHQGVTTTAARRQNEMNQEVNPKHYEKYQEGKDVCQKVHSISLQGKFI